MANITYLHITQPENFYLVGLSWGYLKPPWPTQKEPTWRDGSAWQRENRASEPLMTDGLVKAFRRQRMTTLGHVYGRTLNPFTNRSAARSRREWRGNAPQLGRAASATTATAPTATQEKWDELDRGRRDVEKAYGLHLTTARMPALNVHALSALRYGLAARGLPISRLTARDARMVLTKGNKRALEAMEKIQQ